MDFIKKYRALTEGFSLGGKTNVFRYARGKRQDLEDDLTKINSYNLHREAKKPRYYNPIYVYSTRDIMQCDLADMKAMAEQNDGMKYLVVFCDSFSRKVWIRPVPNKEAVTVYRQLVDIFQETGRFRVLYCDRGREFNNLLLSMELDSMGATMRFPTNKCGTVERLNRTIEMLIYRYLTDRDTDRYIDKLDQIVNLYNDRFQRVIRCTPNFADMPENRNYVINSLSYLYDKIARKRKKPKFKIGDHVLMQKYRDTFARGYNMTFVQERFKIKVVHDKTPIPMYTIESLDGFETIDGRFYENELTPIKTNWYKVEIMRQRERDGIQEARIRLEGYPNRYNTWVPLEEIKDEGDGLWVQLDI